jgi:hypothetical protein
MDYGVRERWLSEFSVHLKPFCLAEAAPSPNPIMTLDSHFFDDRAKPV